MFDSNQENYETHFSTQQMLEEINRLTQECSRLREHLITVEEDYTQELIRAEERENQLRNGLAAAEQQLDLLQGRVSNIKHEEQVRSLCTQRDMALNEVSQLEDKLQQYSASVSNLQLVIEQIQKENERKLQLADRQHSKELEAERVRTEEALNKLRQQEVKFADTFAALGAASRLSETIDIKEQTIAQLKNEVNQRDIEINGLRTQIDGLKISFEGKVDKQIMKSLVLGYFVAPNDKRHEVERLLARILDFNQHEMERANIMIGRDRTRTQSGNWLPFFGGSGESTGESLSQQFVQFLQNESKRNDLHTNQTSKEITRDLSRSLLNASNIKPHTAHTTTHTATTNSHYSHSTLSQATRKPNPFLASASSISLPSLGSRNSSANSSTDNLNNQLLVGPSITPFPILVSTATEDNTSVHSRNSSTASDILQNMLTINTNDKNDTNHRNDRNYTNHFI